tara:strand:- start:2 stop:301 length:300 start_codon:yes stop_codon:yes gene_type:complete
MIKGVYKKGELLQSIRYLNSFEEISNIILEGLKKDKTNPKLNTIIKGLTEIAFYVNYLERTLANKEIDNQTKTIRLLRLTEENDDLLSIKNKTNDTERN